MKVPLSLLGRLEDLDQQLQELRIMRDECLRAIELIEAALDEVAPVTAHPAPGRRRTRVAVLAAIEDVVSTAGDGGTTLEQIAKTTGMKRSRLDPHVARLVEAGTCVVEGDQIMLSRYSRRSLFPDAAK